MNPEEIPLLKQTLRVTALIVVPVAAFLAILSVVALVAVPSSSPAGSREQRVVLPGDHGSAGHAAAPRTRAALRSRGGT
jgi:hypothetical protein